MYQTYQFQELCSSTYSVIDVRWTVDVLYNGSHCILTINVVSLLLCIGWAVYSLLLTLNNMLLLLRKQIHITDDVTSALFYGKVAN